MGTIYENKEAEVAEKKTENEIMKEDPPSAVPDSQKNKLSSYTEKFLNSYYASLKEEKVSGGGTVRVSEVLGGLARLYERVRTVVEYKGEHVLRRNAIERMLKRLIWEKGSARENVGAEKVAESLVRELIWARYLPNNKIDKGKINEVAKIIEKYLYFLKSLDNVPANISPSKIRAWIWGVASSEIEDLLDPSNRELYVNLMFDWFKESFVWVDEEPSEHEKDTQIYLAIHRAHAKSDESIMRYNLLLKEYPFWKGASESDVNKLILEFPKIYSEIEAHLNHKSGHALFRIVKRHSAAFDIFREMAKEEQTALRQVLEDRATFVKKIEKICHTKYAEIRKKVDRGILRSIIYIFLTKVFLALILEIPYEIFMYNAVKYGPISINVIFPPLMMFLIGTSVKVPGAKNTLSIISRLESVVYADSKKTSQSFTLLSASRNKTLSGIFGFIYLLLFLLVFGLITYGLTLLDFSMVGTLIFFFFLSLVMLFGFRVRFNASQLKVDQENETFTGHLTSYLTLPFLNFGFVLSKGLSKINFLTVLLDFLIEAPLKSVIELFEDWISFIKEKKEEVIEIPE